MQEGEARSQRAGLVGRMIGAARLQVSTFEDVGSDRSATRQAVLVVTIVTLATRIGTVGVGVDGLLGWVAFAIFGWAVFAWVTYWVGTRLLPTPQTHADWGQLARVVAFALSPGVFVILGGMPGVGDLLFAVAYPLASMWQLVAVVIAVRQALGYDSTRRAVGVVLVAAIPSFVVYYALVLALGPVLLAPGDANTPYARGNDYLDSGQFQRAIEDFDEAIRLDAEHVFAYHDRGIAYANLGQLQRAIADLDEAIRLDPRRSEAYSDRGIFYSSLGQPARAIEDFDEAIRLDPQNALAYNNRGVHYFKLTQFQRAIEDYDEAIRLDLQYADAFAGLAMAYAALGRDAEAQQHFDRAVALGVDPAFLGPLMVEVKPQG